MTSRRIPVPRLFSFFVDLPSCRLLHPIRMASSMNNQMVFYTVPCMRQHALGILTPQTGRWVDAQLDQGTSESRHRIRHDECAYKESPEEQQEETSTLREHDRRWM